MGGRMRAESNGYGDSWIATKYLWERINYIMTNCFDEDLEDQLFSLMDELAHNYTVDTGKKITEEA
jgi:hypothetical protein